MFYSIRATNSDGDVIVRRTSTGRYYQISIDLHRERYVADGEPGGYIVGNNIEDVIAHHNAASYGSKQRAIAADCRATGRTADDWTRGL